MMTQEEILALFKERGALLQGHFKLTSGLHSDSYLQCAPLLQYACDADRLGAELARRFKDKHARLRFVVAQLGQDGQSKRRCLAGAGLRAANDVAAREN